MAKVKEIRVTFKEKEEDLYNYIQNKSSASAFLKDLASFEKKTEELYLEALKNSLVGNESKKEISVDKLEDRNTKV